MRIFFKTAKFEKVCINAKKARKEYGPRGGDLLLLRLQQLAAASRLSDMRHMPGRCHELTGDRAGVLSIDLVHPLRLLFEPEAPRPVKDDGGLDWTKVEGVVICRVEDTHD